MLVHVIKSMEVERVFSFMYFLKTKLRNSLDSNLGVVVGMYSQKHTYPTKFPYDSIFDSWMNVADVHGCYGRSV